MNFKKLFNVKFPFVDQKNKFSSDKPLKQLATNEGFKKYLTPKRIIFVFFLIIIMTIIAFLRFKGYLTPESILKYIESFTYIAPFIFVIIYFVFMLFLLPTLPLNIGAGFIWGPVWGSLLTILGCGLGVTGAFVFGRITLGGLLTISFDNRMIAWLQNEIDMNGWKIVAFTRVNPVFPTGAINFLFGMTSIKFSTYIWSSIVFLLPFIVIFAVIGSEMNDVVLKGEIVNWLKVLIITSGLITLVCFFHIISKVYNTNQNKE